MAGFLSGVDGRLLSRIDSCADQLGTTRLQVVERALQHYLEHADALLTARSPGTGPDVTVDWANVKRTLVASHCPYANCPHHGNCPIELCPL